MPGPIQSGLLTNTLPLWDWLVKNLKKGEALAMSNGNIASALNANSLNAYDVGSILSTMSAHGLVERADPRSSTGRL